MTVNDLLYQEHDDDDDGGGRDHDGDDGGGGRDHDGDGGGCNDMEGRWRVAAETCLVLLAELVALLCTLLPHCHTATLPHCHTATLQLALLLLLNALHSNYQPPSWQNQPAAAAEILMLIIIIIAIAIIIIVIVITNVK